MLTDGGDLKILEEMLAGGLSKMIEAHCALIGGHSIRDEEIKLGYAVTGNDSSATGAGQYWSEGRRPTHLHQGDRDGRDLCDCDQEGQSRNCLDPRRGALDDNPEQGRRRGGDFVSGFAVHGMTNVTGFGLLGHAREMAIGSGVSLRLYASRVQLLEGALECVRAGHVPGGLKANRTFAESCVGFDDAVAEEVRTLLYDPQTAGGLLISVAEKDAARLVTALRNSAIEAVEIAEVIPKQKPLITVAL